MDKINNEQSLPEIYYAKHMKEGVANYPEHKEVIYITNETITDMAKSMVGKPVFVHHQDVDLDNLKNQMDGVVSESFWNKFDGSWWVKFIAITDKAKEAIRNGWGVSNCYDHLVRGTGGTCINVHYDSEIIGGEFNHLAIVQNPRYEDAKIYNEQEYEQYISDKKNKLEKISNSKGESMETLNEVDVKHLLLSADSNITVGEAIEKLMNSKKIINSKAEILLTNGEKVTVAELLDFCQNEKAEDVADEKANEEVDDKKEEAKDEKANEEVDDKKDVDDEKANEADDKADEKVNEEDKKDEEEKDNACKKNSKGLLNAFKNACLNHSKTEIEKRADETCERIFNGMERAKELGI